MELSPLDEIIVHLRWKISGEPLCEVQIARGSSAEELRKAVSMVSELPPWNRLQLFFGEVLLDDSELIQASGIQTGSICDVVSHDIDVVAIATPSSNNSVNVIILSTKTGEELAVHVASAEFSSSVDIRDLAWAPNGIEAAVAWSGWTDEETNANLIELQLLDMRLGRLLHTLPLNSCGDAIDFQCQFSPCSKMLAVAESSPTRVSIFSVESGFWIHQITAEKVIAHGLDVSLAFLQSGEIVVGGFHGLGIIRANESSLENTCCKVAAGCISFMRVAPNAQYIVTGCETTVRLVETGTFQIVDTLQGQDCEDPFHCVSYAPVSGVLAIGSALGQISLYDMTKGDFVLLASCSIGSYDPMLSQWFTWADGDILAFILKGRDPSLVKVKVDTGKVTDLSIPKVAKSYCFASRNEAIQQYTTAAAHGPGELTDDAAEQSFVDRVLQWSESAAIQHAEAFLPSKFDIQLADDVLLVQLDSHSPRVKKHLYSSKTLQHCFSCVQHAGLEISPHWANGAMLLLPVTQEQAADAGLELKAHHMMLCASDVDNLKSVLAEIPKCRVPAVSLEHGTVDLAHLGTQDIGGTPGKASTDTSTTQTRKFDIDESGSMLASHVGFVVIRSLGPFS